MCASMIASAWTFLFFVILTNDISNFLNLYEWKFWKMIDKDMDKKGAETLLLVTYTFVTGYFSLKLSYRGISRQQQKQRQRQRQQ
ncbi:hypothetical protein E1A91_A10G268000v1 [Gossypium mustelinum]|uniref:Uncharacterized protein n=1 Tax=Gossypium mustelinum TaxID=34275 RepID=A0A5D2XRW2_GOSMU|nr:hypothetical protein E1A91_A10G268000v1 [Gossypium mustelinum]